MPNATLCAKAIVEMLLGHLIQNLSIPSIQHQLVSDGNLPKAYLITDERIQRCRNLDAVELQDRKAEVDVPAAEEKRGYCGMS